MTKVGVGYPGHFPADFRIWLQWYFIWYFIWHLMGFKMVQWGTPFSNKPLLVMEFGYFQDVSGYFM